MTVPLAPQPYARKPSIVDRVLGRLFPTAQYAGLLDPAEQQGLQRQGLLNASLNLLQSGGPQAQQQGTLANIGGAIQGVNFPQMADQALQMQAYRQQQGTQRAIADAASRHPAQPGENREAAYNRFVAIATDVAALPGGAAIVEKMAPLIAALKPDRPSQPQQVTGVVDNRLGSPTMGKTGTFLIPYPGAPRESWEFVPGAPKEKAPTPVERVAGSQLDSASASVRALEDIAQRNPDAAKAAVAAIRAGGWGKLGQLYSEARGFTNDPDAQTFYTEFNNALLSFSPIYGGTRTTQQILQLEKAAVLPALGSGDFAAAFTHLHNRLHDLRAKAGNAAAPETNIAPKRSGNPFRRSP